MDEVAAVLDRNLDDRALVKAVMVGRRKHHFEIQALRPRFASQIASVEVAANFDAELQ